MHRPDTTFYSPEQYLQYLDTVTTLSDSEKLQIRSAVQNEIDYKENEKESWLDGHLFYIFLVIIAIGFIGRIWYEIQERKKLAQRRLSQPVNISESHFLYKGCDLEFDEVTIEIILLKYNAFYRELEKPAQKVFMQKLHAFMQGKQFWMQGEDCYREMPILLSATATQLGFGFPTFHLNNYPNIVIRPQAYIAYEPLRVLTGNVQGNTITISWEHFLKDTLDPDDGNNVGLLEMAHAFAMQMLYTPSKLYKQSAELLRDFYVKLAEFIYLEKQQASSLFDAYSLQNADECWAKCIELFFEKPEEMRYYYPQLYKGVRMVLNQ